MPLQTPQTCVARPGFPPGEPEAHAHGSGAAFRSVTVAQSLAAGRHHSALRPFLDSGPWGCCQPGASVNGVLAACVPRLCGGHRGPLRPCMNLGQNGWLAGTRTVSCGGYCVKPVPTVLGPICPPTPAPHSWHRGVRSPPPPAASAGGLASHSKRDSGTPTG